MKAVLQEAENARNSSVWVNLCICLQILWVFSKPWGDACGHFYLWAKLEPLRRRMTTGRPGFVLCWAHILLLPSLAKSEKNVDKHPKHETLCARVFSTLSLFSSSSQVSLYTLLAGLFWFPPNLFMDRLFFPLGQLKTKATCHFWLLKGHSVCS